jgi:hypothetical protein
MRELSCALAVGRVRGGKSIVGFTIPTHQQKGALLAFDRWLLRETDRSQNVLIGSIIALRAKYLFSLCLGLAIKSALWN